jgi:glycosyltransferase involved in cell wall biosynthesis
MRLIPNFISESEIAESRRIRETIGKVLYVGGVIETKGAFDVLALARRFPAIEFRLVGKASSEVEDFARQNEISNAVFTGPKDRDGVKAELADADVFLFMTYFRGEGFSNALAEAMAAGLPCIATDWAANKDMIGTEGGAVVAVNDVDAAEKALRAMMSAETRKAQSEANINKVKAEYIDSVVIDQYVDCYNDLSQ